MMPEQPEISLMGQFIENCSGLREFKDFEYGLDIPYKKWKNWKPNYSILNDRYGGYNIEVAVRGKELMLSFRPYYGCAYYNGKGGIQHVIFNMGMTGNWIFGKYDELRQDRHNKLFFIDYEDTCICLRDPRKFATWKAVKDWDDWSSNRGPDPVYEHQEFIDHIYLLIMKKHKSTFKPLLEVMLDQYVFNGVGNYLRAEILDRFDVNPLVNLQYLNNNNPGDTMLLCLLVKQVCEESYALGGGQIKDFLSPTGQDPKGFNDWLQCYGKKESIIDNTGRRFWYDSKWDDFLKNSKYVS